MADGSTPTDTIVPGDRTVGGDDVSVVPAAPVPARFLGAVGIVLLGLFGWLASVVHNGQKALGVDAGPDRLAARLVAALPVDRLDAVDGRWLLLPALLCGAGLAWWVDRRGDRRLTKAVVVGPLATAIVGQFVVRPVVGRRLDGVFTFPSGPASVAAALVVAAAIAWWWPARRPAPAAAGPDPHRSRPVVSARAVVATVGAVATLAVVGLIDAGGVSVASDVVGGLLLGSGLTAVTAAVCARFVPADRPLIARAWLRYGACVALGAAGSLVGVIRLPYFTLSPGSLIPLNSAISVADPAAAGAGPLHGTYSGLTVRSRTLTIGEWTWHELRRSADEIVPLRAIVPAGQDTEEHRRIERQRFVDASAVAVAVAQRGIGQPVTVLGDGALVTGIDAGSPADGVLRVGDAIVELGGSPVATEDELRQALTAAATAAGFDPAPSTAEDGPVATELKVRDLDGTVRTESVQLRRLPRTGRFGLGIGVATANLRFESPIAITVDGGSVGGPSAGLLTALAVYDILTDEDLAAGRHVAGTGTLALNGVVGRIGGIEEKVRAAVAARADVFLAPADQADAARAAAHGRIEVVGVRTFDEALAVLRGA